MLNLLAASLVPLLLVAVPGAALAGPGGDAVAEVELVSGGATSDGAMLVGLRIRLAGGFKTYWRYPGDSGIPPEFTFERSTNVADVEVEWPAPGVHHDGYGWIVGYQDEVVFPLVVTPRDASRPVDLAVDLAYGVCSDICIPMTDGVEATLDGAAGAAMEVEAWRARVPVALDADDPRGGVVHAGVQEGGSGPVLRVDVRLPDASEPLLVVEDVAGSRSAILADRAERSRDDIHTFLLPIDGDARLEIGGASLRITAISGEFAFEQTVRLD